jgi:hypothetical protein
MLHIIRQAVVLIQVRVQVAVRTGVTHQTAQVLSIDLLGVGVPTALVTSPHHYTTILGSVTIGNITVAIMLHIIRQVEALIQLNVPLMHMVQSQNGAILRALALFTGHQVGAIPQIAAGSKLQKEL